MHWVLEVLMSGVRPCKRADGIHFKDSKLTADQKRAKLAISDPKLKCRGGGAFKREEIGHG